jgi:hypothetical protein
VCRKVVLDQTSDHMLQDNMGRIGRKSISVRSAASRGIRWMRTVGLAPEAITWAGQVPTVKWLACFESQSRGCHRSHGLSRDEDGFSRALRCESRDVVTSQGVGRSEDGGEGGVWPYRCFSWLKGMPLWYSTR